MSNLAYRQSKIQEKRKQTPWREFLMECVSRRPVNIYKNSGMVCRYPKTGREGNIISIKKYNLDNYVEIEYKNDFFENFENLFLVSNKSTVAHFLENSNSDFTDMAYGCKDCYLCFSAGLESQSCLYSACICYDLKYILNSFGVTDHCTNVYQSKIVTNSLDIFYSFNIHNSSDIRFSSNLIGCKHCVHCDSLENVSYAIYNIIYDKETYKAKVIEILTNKNLYTEYQTQVSNNGANYNSTNVTGSAMSFSNDIENGYYGTYIKESRNIYYGVGSESGAIRMYDGFDVGINAEDFYGVVCCGTNASHLYCTYLGGGDSMNLFYCMSLESCSFCLGCIGLKNKSYCILNKQYTKEERYIRVDEIFAQMESTPHPNPLPTASLGEGARNQLGQFFPATMNPFYFNDTAAYLIDPTFTKEEVTAAGYLWRDDPIKVDIPDGATVVSVKDLDIYEGRKDNEGNIYQGDPSVSSGGQGTRRINPDILKVIIQDEEGNVYKIVKMEYDFLLKHGLPLPRKHWLDRMKENFRIQ